LAVALFFAQDYRNAQLHAEKAKHMGYAVDPRFFEALRQQLM